MGAGLWIQAHNMPCNVSRVKQSSAAQQSQMLNFDFQSIVAGLQAGSYQSQEVVKQDIQEVCRTAADSFSGQEQVPAESHGIMLHVKHAWHAGPIINLGTSSTRQALILQPMQQCQWAAGLVECCRVVVE